MRHFTISCGIGSCLRFAVSVIILLFLSGCGLLMPISDSSSADENNITEVGPTDSSFSTVEPDRSTPHSEIFHSSEKEGVAFVDSDRLQPVLTIAKANEKLIFLDFYTNWCLPCKVMDEQVFDDPGAGALMNRHFISMKINAETANGGNLAFLYGVSQFPTLIFLDAEGKELARKEGSLGLTNFLDFADSVYQQQRKSK